ncbi:hypothetical protein RaK2_00265 [Klebsiella phage vB_KleM_RaK2]|uniref:Uncharacterized protein n=1 Tax=Klebsiella phage vB_KleM_RaK2 TaxID=1147094 RepID=H6X472_9CAUD|nr:hypothetical protein F403_gp270 [Klebsiella phage vB_KleM_RaK2]AFA44538.1 hypothetical protein RaK2_00265 [Klebsiella phage vB_KleM_RaK2]
MHILLSLVLSTILLSFLPASVSANNGSLCLSNDGEWYEVRSDPDNPNNLTIDGEVFYILQQQTHLNKKVLTFKSTSGTLALLVLVGNPETKKVSIDMFLTSEIKSVKIQCK